MAVGLLELMDLGMEGPGFRIPLRLSQGLGFRGLGFRVWGFRV